MRRNKCDKLRRRGEVMISCTKSLNQTVQWARRRMSTSGIDGGGGRKAIKMWGDEWKRRGVRYKVCLFSNDQ